MIFILKREPFKIIFSHTELSANFAWSVTKRAWTKFSFNVYWLDSKVIFNNKKQIFKYLICVYLNRLSIIIISCKTMWYNLIKSINYNYNVK